MFEKLRQTLEEMIARATPPEERREILARMKDTLVQARVGIEDLRGGAELTRKRLAHERRELETVQRRRRQAEAILDEETVTVATRFEALHAERVGVLERKLEAQLAEVELAERDVAAMTAELRAAASAAGAVAPGPLSPEDPLEDRDAGVREEIDHMARSRNRAAAESEAEARLEALKRRMGK